MNFRERAEAQVAKIRAAFPHPRKVSDSDDVAKSDWYCVFTAACRYDNKYSLRAIDRSSSTPLNINKITRPNDVGDFEEAWKELTNTYEMLFKREVFK